MPRISGRSVPLGLDGEPREAVPRPRKVRFSLSLERGLAILECFSPERPILGIVDISNELGMSPSTTHRYVLTLTRLGYLVRDTKRKYSLGLPVIDLGMSALNGTSLRERGRVHLEDLHSRTGFTVSIAVLDGSEALLVDHLRGRRSGQQQIDLGQGPGSRLPLYCTALGKLLLADLSERAQRDALAEMTLRRRAPGTITRKNVLRAELRNIREQSLAAAEEELAPGLSSIAAPVRCASREVLAAVGMDAHSSMISITDFLDELGPHLIATADRISALLGYRRDDELPGPCVNGLGPLRGEAGQ